MRRPMACLALAAALTLGGCAGVELSDPAGGELKGALFVMWVGEGDGRSGDGQFVFVPDPRDRLTFTRKNGAAPGAVIRPDVMYTDGGSIPHVLQAFRGLSPWGYAPAYMVHDWVFVARYCLRDGVETERFRGYETIGFNDQAQILYEAIEALAAARRVRRDDAARDTVAAAVGSPIARALWDQEGACKERLVPQAVADKARADLRGELARAAAPARARTFGRAAPPPAPRGGSHIIQRIAF